LIYGRHRGHVRQRLRGHPLHRRSRAAALGGRAAVYRGRRGAGGFLGAQRRGCRPGGSPNARPGGRSADGREGDSGRLAAMAPGDRARIVVLGVLGVFAYHALFFWALQFTPASLSALIVPTTLPLATALMARAVLGERLGPYTLAGVAVAT